MTTLVFKKEKCDEYVTYLVARDSNKNALFQICEWVGGGVHLIDRRRYINPSPKYPSVDAAMIAANEMVNMAEELK